MMTKSIVTLGGLPITVDDCDGAARDMIVQAVGRRDKAVAPHYVTSANGQVLSECARMPDIKALFEDADIIHADGQPMVKASRLFCKETLPERIATTDLVHNTARMAEQENVTFFFLGASQEVIDKAVARMKDIYPDLIFAGHRNGYIKPEEEEAVIDEINSVKPDILWIGMGVPLEQKFISRNKEKLTGVGVIKTSGGLFDFLSGHNSRAPQWMQDFGLEWAYRVWLEPRRLLWRYLTTNPHAAWLLVTRSG